ncbi:MAG: hypothetical protein DI556_03655 [Rhodovulum sulfidophilum]|uniref:Uncharacterized protein n=1 Tax=Rhodovulum sulfidophilum TaxID=35806 RepID=A0A2W5NGC6_RHOSU|nr:MAG: hypothetical protein DI556_03655 [Rhodovulum sulfidophilum]
MSESEPSPPTDVTADLVRLMPRDAVYMLRFLGESQLRLQRHFQDFIAARLARLGVTPDSHPMIHGFIETHALTLRDFVFAGVSMAHQLRVAEMERLLGDTTSLLSVDIWDELRDHIETAERQFEAQAAALPDQLEGYRAPEPPR